MQISRYVCLFMIYSFMGWVYETLFCTLKDGKWANRGFLYGPCCPIYGVGAVTVSAVVYLLSEYGVRPEPWQVFAISVPGSAVLEYGTSWMLEKIFHAAWWDYSDCPLNLHGRICLFASLGFGFGGVLTVYVIAPFTENAVDAVPPIVLEFLALLVLSVFAADLTLTVTVLLHFDETVVRMENTFNHRMETFVDATVRRSARVKDGIVRTGRSVNGQIDALGRATKGAVSRIKSFRDRDERKKTVKNGILLRFRNAAKRDMEDGTDGNALPKMP